MSPQTLLTWYHCRFRAPSRADSLGEFREETLGALTGAPDGIYFRFLSAAHGLLHGRLVEARTNRLFSESSKRTATPSGRSLCCLIINEKHMFVKCFLKLPRLWMKSPKEQGGFCILLKYFTRIAATFTICALTRSNLEDTMEKTGNKGWCS